MSKKRAQTGGGRYVQLHHFMLDSAAWRALTPAARAVYVEIARRYNGANNGRLALSVREAACACNINKDTVGRAVRELTNAGFIEETRHGGLSRKTRVASEWRLTAFTCDLTGSLKTWAFLKRGKDLRFSPVPNEGRECPKRRDSLSETRGQSPDECPKRGDRFAALETSPVQNEGTHIVYQYRAPVMAPPLAPPDVDPHPTADAEPRPSSSPRRPGPTPPRGACLSFASCSGLRRSERWIAQGGEERTMMNCRQLN
jgi:hypothetical protein